MINKIRFPNTTCIGWSYTKIYIYIVITSFQTLRVSVEANQGYYNRPLTIKFPNTTCIGWSSWWRCGEIYLFSVSKHYVYRLKSWRMGKRIWRDWFPNTTCIGWSLGYLAVVCYGAEFPNTTCIGWRLIVFLFYFVHLKFPNTTCIGWRKSNARIR